MSMTPSRDTPCSPKWRGGEIYNIGRKRNLELELTQMLLDLCELDECELFT